MADEERITWRQSKKDEDVQFIHYNGIKIGSIKKTLSWEWEAWPIKLILTHPDVQLDQVFGGPKWPPLFDSAYKAGKWLVEMFKVSLQVP